MGGEIDAFSHIKYGNNLGPTVPFPPPGYQKVSDNQCIDPLRGIISFSEAWNQHWEKEGFFLDDLVAHSDVTGSDDNAAAKGAGDGPVVFKIPPGATPAEIAQMKEYARLSNQALDAGALSSTGRVSTTGALRADASAAAAAERARAAAAGTPYTGQAGHVPDTTWGGAAQPFTWLDLSPKVNSSLGAQARWYPLGYKPTGFTVE